MRLYQILFFAILFIGCNTEKRAAKKSDKYFFKSVSWDKTNVHKRCSDIAPPIVMTKDSFIYKQGEVIYKKGEPVYVEVDCDSVINYYKNNSVSAKNAQSGATGKESLVVRIKCPPCDSLRIDSFYHAKYNTEVDRNKEYALQADNQDLRDKLTKAETRLKTHKSVNWVLGIAIALYFIVKLIIRKFKG